MRSRLGTKSNFVRIVSVFVFVCTVCAIANAYTVVMHGGRRLEIPSAFIVTATTLTYEVSAGVQITINVAAIDIPATEKANNEASGSLLRRIDRSVLNSRSSSELSVQPSARRTITNRDLESSMRRRQESELTYERRRKELGLPSVEEARKQAAAQSAAIATELEQTRASERESESYWRERAAALRTEMAALDAQIKYVRSRLDEPLFSGGSGSFTNFSLGLPFVSFGGANRRGWVSSPLSHPRVFGPPVGSTQVSGRVTFGGGATRGQVLVNPSRFPRSHGLGVPVIASSNVFASTGQPYLYDDRNQLVTQFNELAAERAGLTARWRELEDEARRAGAPPGWLRK